MLSSKPNLEEIDVRVNHGIAEMWLHIGHRLSLDLQAIPDPHVAVDLWQTSLHPKQSFTYFTKLQRKKKGNSNCTYVYGSPVLYLYLKRMHHDLHQHLLVGQEAIQVQALALYTLRISNQTITFKNATHIQNIHRVISLTYLTEEHGIVAMQWQVKCHLIWSRLQELYASIKKQGEEVFL